RAAGRIESRNRQQNRWMVIRVVRVQFVVPSARGTNAGALDSPAPADSKCTRLTSQSATTFSHAQKLFFTRAEYCSSRPCVTHRNAMSSRGATRRGICFFPFCACPILLALKVALLRTRFTFFASSAYPLLSAPRVFQTRAVVESQRRISNRVLIMVTEQIFHVPHHRHAVSQRELRSHVQTK